MTTYKGKKNIKIKNKFKHTKSHKKMNQNDICQNDKYAVRMRFLRNS